MTAQSVQKTRLRVGGIWQVDDHILLESLRDVNIWGIPGGGLEPGETVKEACQREFREELALDVICERTLFTTENIWLKHDPATEAAPVQIREYCFYMQVVPRQPLSEARPALQSAEPHLKFQWFPVQTIPQLSFVPPFMVTVLQDLTNQPPLITHRQIDNHTDNP